MNDGGDPEEFSPIFYLMLIVGIIGLVGFLMTAGGAAVVGGM